MGLGVIFWLLGYFCGSIPFGVVVMRWLHKDDPRKSGSGNMGASNVFRLGGMKAATLVFLGDMLKGFLPPCFVLWTGVVPEEMRMFSAELAGLGSVMGHIFPLWLKGQGGKAVATGFGVSLCLCPTLALIALLCWGATLALSRYASLASLVAVSTLVVLHWFMPSRPTLLVLMAVLIFWQHRHNLQRLMTGTEAPIKGPVDRGLLR